FVRCAPDATVTEEEVQTLVRSKLAPFKTPRHVVFVETFPLTPSGKIQKFALRDAFVAGRAPA
ncbi:MAG TPA: AMP-dependent synthetase, partial [Acidimicrobiia bacterium]|nr:AMP-dependent synthetase [Acidimicrobiia bacterium]